MHSNVPMNKNINCIILRGSRYKMGKKKMDEELKEKKIKSHDVFN